MKKETAREISSLMLELSGKLNESIVLVASDGNADETEYYKKTVGRIMGDLFVEIMRPIYKEYPDLKPHGLR